MAEYAKTKVNNVISVTSIATVLRISLQNRIVGNDQHNFPEIFYMAEGQGMTIVDGVKHTLHAGEMIIYASNSIHGEGTGGVAKIISFETEKPLPSNLLNRVITLTGQQRVQLADAAVAVADKADIHRAASGSKFHISNLLCW
jgi:gentisate 1,2-dioxygenase